MGIGTAPTAANLWLAAAAASAPSEGFGFRAPPVADTARKASRCRPQVRERIAEARAATGEGAEIRTPLPRVVLRRSYARRRRADLIRHGAGYAAPRHLPQGEGYVLRTEHRGAENAHSPALKPVLKAKAPCSSRCSKQKPRAHLSTGLFFV